MVAIIGKDPTLVKRVTCRKCSSILEYVLSEVGEYKSTDYTGCTDIIKYVKCPCCGHEVTVKGY